MHSALKIPGYSGHIPQKLDIIGHTTGESNKQAGQNFRYNRKPAMVDGGASIIRDQMLATQMRSSSIDGRNEGP